MGMVVGGETAWKVRTQKDLVVAYHWVNGEPAMVLFPIRRRLGAAAFIIGLSHAYKYAEKNGYPTPYCVRQAMVAAGVMAMDQTRQTCLNITEVILDNLEDLVKMPPELPRKLDAPAVGEVSLMDRQTGRTLTQGEITDLPAELH
jgi:hypothetical protein